MNLLGLWAADPEAALTRCWKQKLLLVLLAAVAAWSSPALAERPRAVVVAGPVDPPLHKRTRAHIAEAQMVARVVEEAGYHVVRLYHPEATWDRVREASRGASLFIYYGHGNGYGWQGHTDSSWIDGLCLTDPENPDAVRAGKGVPGGNADDLVDLELRPGATVALVHTCYAAGSSQGDWRAVSHGLASKRVSSYADAFFRAGAGEYLATNYMGVAPYFFGQWSKGQELSRAIVHRMYGQRVHSEPGVVLVETSNRASNPQPWVSAWVERPADMPFAGDGGTSDYVVTLAALQAPGGVGDAGRRENLTVASASLMGPPERRDAGAPAAREVSDARGASDVREASDARETSDTRETSTGVTRTAGAVGEGTPLRRLQGSLDECYRGRSCGSWSGYSNSWARFVSRWSVREWAGSGRWAVAERIRSQRPVWQVGNVGTLAQAAVDAPGAPRGAQVVGRKPPETEYGSPVSAKRQSTG
jgi:hypothetical protein